MKKLFLFVAVGLFLWAGLFYWNNLRGVGPAVRPPKANIAQIFETNKPSPQEAANTTGFPLILPDGFSINLFASDLGNPRVLAWDPSGTLLASIPSRGTVVALPDTDNDGAADSTTIVAEGLSSPHGLAFLNGKLYIAETNQVAVFDYDGKSFKASGKKKIIDLPSGGNHFSRTIGFGPDGRLYIAVGSSCNVCNEKDWRRAKILVANANGTDFKEFATGLRNSVFFIWHPTTREMWATDMGRDLIGDNIPPEEVNIVKEGGFYGWPYCYNNRIQDKTFDSSEEARTRCEGSLVPHITFQAHSAPLGLAFIPDSWPTQYRGDLLISYHGSWNRTKPTGYKVARFDLNNSNRESDFISGWLTGNDALGRPVDLLFDSKGNLFVSDDKAGVIYKVTSQK